MKDTVLSATPPRPVLLLGNFEQATVLPKMSHKLYLIEMIRGLAAIQVVLAHLVTHYPRLKSNDFTLAVSQWGITAVIVFFFLSGVVIHLSTQERNLHASEFLYRRAVRIVPLYALACLLAFAADYLVRSEPLSSGKLIGHGVFLASLQGWIVQVTASNPVLWTLSYEMWFYVLFAMCLGRHKNVLLFAWVVLSFVMLAITPLTRNYASILNQVVSVLAYSSIWLTGYYTVAFSKKVSMPLSFGALVVGFLPMLARMPMFGDYLDVGQHVMIGFACVPIFVVILNHERGTVVRSNLAWGCAGLAIYGLLIVSFWSISPSRFIPKTLYACFPLASVLVIVGGSWLVERYLLVTAVKTVSVYLGGISYALYLFHYLVITAVVYLPLHEVLSIPLALFLVFGVSSMLEFGFQRWITRSLAMWIQVPRPHASAV